MFETQLYALVYSKQLKKLAVCGDDGVRVVDMQTWVECKNEYREFARGSVEGCVEKLNWSADGQILSVATQAGSVFNYLMSVPVLATASGRKLMYLSSLRLVSQLDCASNQPPVTIEVAVEPTFVALGPKHVAVGMNNHCWFYASELVTGGNKGGGGGGGSTKGRLVSEKQYMSSVSQCCLNAEYAAVLCDGRAYLHVVEPQGENWATGDSDVAREADKYRDEVKVFPDSGSGSGDADDAITSITLTDDFLVYVTAKGVMHHFYIPDWVRVCVVVHVCVRVRTCVSIRLFLKLQFIFLFSCLHTHIYIFFFQGDGE